MCKWIRIGDWLDEEIVSAGIKEPRNSQQEKKVYAKMHGFCCDTKFIKRVSAVRKRIT